MLKPISEVGKLQHIIGVWKEDTRWYASHLFWEWPNEEWVEYSSDKVRSPQYFAPLPEDGEEERTRVKNHFAKILASNDPHIVGLVDAPRGQQEKDVARMLNEEFAKLEKHNA